jgi:hypothetical protein
VLLSPELQELMPTQADVQCYQEHGYYVAGKVIPDDVIDRAVEGAERHWAGERDWPMPITGGYSDWRRGDGDGIRNSEYTALQNREIRALVQYPVIGAIASKLAQSPVIRLWDDQLVSKPPSRGITGPVVGWHTDRAYWMTCTSEEMLTAWIPLQDTPVEMGPVIYIDGSHRWPGTDEMRSFNSQDLATLEERFSGPGITERKRVIALRRGEVSFHHSRTIHGSDANCADRPRTSLALHLQDASNRYRVFHNSAGIPWHITNDDLARKGADGLPDYTDPAVFPVLWAEGDGV